MTGHIAESLNKFLKCQCGFLQKNLKKNISWLWLWNSKEFSPKKSEEKKYFQAVTVELKVVSSKKKSEEKYFQAVTGHIASVKV